MSTAKLSRTLHASASRPSAVHGQRRAVDKRGLVRAEEGNELGDLSRFDEAFDRWRGEHNLFYHLFFRYPLGLGLVGDLALHERRPHEGWADAVRRYASGPSLERQNLRETLQTMLRRHISRLERGGP